MADANELIDRFSVWDYLVFVTMLVISAAIGVYFGYTNRKKGTNEFLVAGKSMGAFPVAMSLIASFMSAIALLGTPSEVYQNGLIYVIIGFSYIFVTFAAAYMYVPVFWDLQVTSTFYYLEKRFSRSVRMMGSLVFMIQMLLYMSVVVYAPALALSQVTGIGVYVSVTTLSVVCIFYTTLGGMKAVLWTDVLQVCVMLGSMIFIVIYGVIQEGGLERIWNISLQGNRTELVNWDFDPRTRHTVFSLIVGGYCTWLSLYGVSQAQIQRYLCLKTKNMAIRALVINLVGWLFLNTFMCLGGLLIYAKYVDCDPVSAGFVEKVDQLFPLFVMETLGHLKGLPGLFVAGIFAGSLSTVSSGLNSLAATTLEDFVKAKWPDINDHKATILSKMFSLIYGIITFALVFVIEQLGDLLQASLGIVGLIGGPLLGVFTLGMFFPWANSKGAFIGTIIALVLNIWIFIGSQISISNEEIIMKKLPLNTCDLVLVNGSFIVENSRPLEVSMLITSETDIVVEMYKLSYMLYSALGCVTAILAGMIVSALTGLQNLRKLDPKLLSPAVSWFKWFIPGYYCIGTDIKAFHDTTGTDKFHAGISQIFNGQTEENSPKLKEESGKKNVFIWNR